MTFSADPEIAALRDAIDLDFLKALGHRAHTALAILDKDAPALTDAVAKMDEATGNALVDEIGALMETAEGLSQMAHRALARLATVSGALDAS